MQIEKTYDIYHEQSIKLAERQWMAKLIDNVAKSDMSEFMRILFNGGERPFSDVTVHAYSTQGEYSLTFHEVTDPYFMLDMSQLKVLRREGFTCVVIYHNVQPDKQRTLNCRYEYVHESDRWVFLLNAPEGGSTWVTKPLHTH